ncbi:UvrD-helicase domain-containing protein [Enterobacter cloacae]
MIQFTQEQQNAIDFPGNMVLTACPGSGKTTVVIEKIAMDLRGMKNFQGVIAISHTNKASDELLKRSKKFIVDVKSSFFGTIDKFFLREIIFNFMNHFASRPSSLKIIKFNDLLPEQQAKMLFLLADGFVILKEDVNALNEIYTLYSQGVFVLEMAPLMSLFILTYSHACQRYIKAKYKSIYIDEYQDSGFIQHEIFKLISMFGIKAVAVGDADQSIHEYAKKYSKYLIELKNGDNGFEPFELTLNHRCHYSIVNYASRLIRPECTLIAGGNIQVYRVCIPGYFEEIASWIDSGLESIKKSFGIKYNNQIAILAVSNKSVSYISSCLKVQNRAYVDDKLSKLGTDVSRLIMDLLHYRYNNNHTAQDIIDNYSESGVTRRQVKLLRREINLVRKIDDCNLIASVRGVLTLLGDYNLESIHIDGINEVLQVDAVRNNYLPINQNEVQIMNIHKSKGLEFDCVYHLDLYDHVLPKREYPVGSRDVIYKNEKQCLNLHYVALTRAKKFVVLVTSTERIGSKGYRIPALPSQFFDRAGLEGLFKKL